MNNDANSDPAPEHRAGDDNDKTSAFVHDSGQAHEDPSLANETLFEVYQPRPVSQIIEQQYRMRESHAAEAAAIILRGVDLPEFSDEIPIQAIESDSAGEPVVHIRVQKLSPLGCLLSPGAQFVYALVIITLLGGLIGLAATLHTPELVLVAGIASPMLLPICIWKWIRWLDSTPYYYRLLTSLGEDARNLLHVRLFWKHRANQTR